MKDIYNLKYNLLMCIPILAGFFSGSQKFLNIDSPSKSLYTALLM